MPLEFVPSGYAPAPGTCVSCGISTGDMIDTRRNEEWVGAILICVNCIRGAASTIPELRLVLLEDHEKELDSVGDVVEESERIVESKAELHATILAALNHFDARISGSIDIDSVADEEAAAEDHGDVGGHSSNADEADTETDEEVVENPDPFGFLKKQAD